jgi:hypothetical protein
MTSDRLPKDSDQLCSGLIPVRMQDSTKSVRAFEAEGQLAVGATIELRTEAKELVDSLWSVVHELTDSGGIPEPLTG